MHAQVAVIVVSYNTRELLLDCIASVFESTKSRNVEVVVVDNASEDGSYEALRQAYPEVASIRNPINLGFGAACNQGINATNAKLILLLNSDARLTSQAYQTMSDYLEREPRCGAAGCRLVDQAGREAINTRNFLTPFNQALELAGARSGSSRLRRTHRAVLDQNSVDCSVDWIDAACLMVRRSALDECGLFDERFFMYSEDEDLCFRLRRSGWLVCFCAAGTAFHKGSASTRLFKKEMLRHFYLSQMLFLTKHHGRHSTSLYAVLMRTILVLKNWFLRDAHRRESAREHLNALTEARAEYQRTNTVQPTPDY